MLTKRIIPCLDVKDGRVVKGTHFINHRDAGDPVELARYYYQQGADELTFLDITATPEARATVADIVERVSKEIFMPLTVGGGLRTIADMRRVLVAGADKVGINTAAVQHPELITEGAEKFGSQCIVISIDARRIPGKQPTAWEVVTHSGMKGTGIDALWWAREVVRLGAGEILLNSLDTDGKQTGYDIELLRTISEAVPIPVIASSGAGSPEDMFQAIIHGKADAVLAASIFHYGKYTVGDIKQYLANKGVPIRAET
ncbi:MAG TPA: imidazole glycerol phosphate synthase subunit HisF [Dehalococcoidales bacterium]|nr:imidazole glycerol phosphate synthase subunit HisF [Dehalococcoidales bacterium]